MAKLYSRTFKSILELVYSPFLVLLGLSFLLAYGEGKGRNVLMSMIFMVLWPAPYVMVMIFDVFLLGLRFWFI